MKLEQPIRVRYYAINIFSWFSYSLPIFSKKSLSALSCRQDTRNFHKTFSTFKDGRLNPRKSLPKINGQTAHTSQDKAQLCADYLGDVFQMPNGPEFDDNQQMVDDTIQNLPNSSKVPSRDPRAHALEEEVQPGEVSELVKKLRRGSPGPDGITNTLLKEGPQTLYVLMSKLFTASISASCLMLGKKHT